MSQSLKTLNAAYYCEWYTANSKFRKHLRVLMERAKIPVKLTAGGFSTLTLQNFSKVRKMWEVNWLAVGWMTDVIFLARADFLFFTTCLKCTHHPTQCIMQHLPVGSKWQKCKMNGTYKQDKWRAKRNVSHSHSVESPLELLLVS